MLSKLIKPLIRFSGVIQNEKIAAYIIRTLVVTIVAIYCFYAYLLGWTNYFYGDYSHGSAWAKRIEYINKGIDSIAHLNIVSVALGTSIIIVPSILLLLLIKTGKFLDKHITIFVVYAILFVLTMHTVFRLDTPFNYYASRYFLPILVPLLFILFALVLDSLNRRIFVIPALAAILLFNAPYVYNLYTHPLTQDNFKTIDSINTYIPKDSYVFLIGAKDLREYLQLSLKYTNNSKVIYINTKGASAEEIDGMLKSYGRALRIKSAYCITEDIYVPADISECRIIKRIDSYHLGETNVIYPYKTYDSEHTYYIFNKELDPKNIILYPRSEWLIGHHLSLESSYEITPDDKYLMIESDGNWRPYFNNDLRNLKLRVSINGIALKLKREEGTTIYYSLPEGVATINSIDISSSTFNPRKLGISDDPRNLGIDIKSIIITDKELDRRNILTYPASEWLVNGDAWLYSSIDREQGDTFIVVESQGNWKPYFGNDISNLNLRMYVNGAELSLEKEADNKFYFRLPRDMYAIERIRITSSTFNPKKLGINDDNRDLGVDIKSVVIE